MLADDSEFEELDSDSGYESDILKKESKQKQ